MGVQAFVAETAIEGLHESVVGRFARPRAARSPAIQRFGDKLRAIIHPYGPRGTAYRCDPVLGLDIPATLV